MAVIDDGLARAMAQMVALGLTPGDGELERARATLQAIGVMLINSDRDNEVVREILALPGRGEIKLNNDGSISVTVGEPGEPES